MRGYDVQWIMRHQNMASRHVSVSVQALQDGIKIMESRVEIVTHIREDMPWKTDDTVHEDPGSPTLHSDKS